MQEWTNRKPKNSRARPLSLPVASDTPSLPVSKYGSATPQEPCSRHSSNGHRKDSSEWHTHTPTHTQVFNFDFLKIRKLCLCFLKKHKDCKKTQIVSYKIWDKEAERRRGRKRWRQCWDFALTTGPPSPRPHPPRHGAENENTFPVNVSLLWLWHEPRWGITAATTDSWCERCAVTIIMTIMTIICHRKTFVSEQ